jgi:hypothetical protein
MNGSNDRLGQAHKRFGHSLNQNQIIFCWWTGDIPPRTECPAVAPQQKHPNSIVTRGQVNGGKKRTGKLIVNGVEFVGAVQGHGHDAVRELGQ